MAQITVSVPDDKLAAFIEAIAKLNEPAAPPPAAPPTGDDWTPQLADQAVKGMADLEKRLLFRVADARGRVPLSELSRDFGLPGEAALEQDFPTLAAFCAGTGRPALPVLAAGSGDDGWYWMPRPAARMLRDAVRRAYELDPDPTPPPAPVANAQAPPAAASGSPK